MEDTSLDEFLDAGEENSEVDTDDPEDVTPATPTYRWSPEETVCDACGETARRHWRSEVGLVCRECKEW